MSNYNRFIKVRTQFVGFHRYGDAPKDVSFLQHLHRHVFHVSLEIEVLHDNRELEFFLVKRGLENFIRTTYPEKYPPVGEGVGSCEMIAEKILQSVEAEFPGRDVEVIVSEDSENEARVNNH